MTDSLAKNPYCLFGWKSPKPCNYTGGCYCWREYRHAGKCKCDFCGSKCQREQDWDDVERAEANK